MWGREAFLGDYRNVRVLVNHGDRCGSFAATLTERGVDASAPRLNETVTV